jgi:hypothetical protein
MAKLPVKYDKRLRQVLGYRAVWEPGSTFSLGDVVKHRKGLFTDVGALSEFGVTFKRESRQEAKLTLNAQGVSETLIQGGVELTSLSELKPSVKAQLKIKFGRSNTYHLKTTKLSGQDIGNLLQVGRQIARLSDWRFGEYYVVWRILNAKDFTFLGSLRRNRELSFSGTGKAIAKYMSTGASTNISKSSSAKLDLEIIGSGGPVAIGVTRIKKNGQPRDV